MEQRVESNRVITNHVPACLKWICRGRHGYMHHEIGGFIPYTLLSGWNTHKPDCQYHVDGLAMECIQREQCTLHDKKYVETCSSNISFQNHGHYFGAGPPFVAITGSKLLGRLSTKCWNIAAGTCFPSATRTLMRFGANFERFGLARSRRSNWSQRCSMELRSGLSADQWSSSTPILTNHFCMDLALCTGALSCWNKDFSSLELSGLAWTMKNSPRPLFLFHQTLKWLVGKVASYNGATLKLTELFNNAILRPMFVCGDCMAVCSILYTCQQRVWLKQPNRLI